MFRDDRQLADIALPEAERSLPPLRLDGSWIDSGRVQPALDIALDEAPDRGQQQIPEGGE